jgi:hypothetical protein
MGKARSIEDYSCCFCGQTIPDEEDAAVQLIATNLWQRKVAQPLHAHAKCGSEHITKGDFSAVALRDGETGYTLEEIVWGEHEASRLPFWGCLAVILVLAAGAYAIFS